MTISLTMIVRDEESVLARCLESVQGLTDEIVIADTGSQDSTRTIALHYTPKVFSIPWQQDFAKARNAAIDHAEGDYIFWLDADDLLPPESRAEFAALRQLLEQRAPDVVMCPYISGGLTFLRERLFRHDARFRFCGRVHECVQPSGIILHAKLGVLHVGSPKQRGTRNLDIYRQWEREEQLSPRDLYYYGRELYYHGQYEEAIRRLEHALALRGWYVNQIDACRVLARCRHACGDRARARLALLRSFDYGEPRAAAVCELAALLWEENRLDEAAFWYRTALRCRDHRDEGDFEEAAFRNAIPLKALCELSLARGDHTSARSYCLLAEQAAQNDTSLAALHAALFGKTN